MRKIAEKGQFKSTMHVATDNLMVDMGKLLRQAGLRMYRELIVFTPKDTGWASQHWSIGLNRTTESESVVKDSLSKTRPGDVIHVFNNVVYIARLDEGWSSQRPIGFSKIVNKKIENWVNEQSASLSVEVYKDV